MSAWFKLLAAAFVVALMAAVPISAHASVPIKAHAGVAEVHNVPRLPHAGQPVHTTIGAATLFQCPNEHCNEGVVASTSDTVYDLCFLIGNQPSFGGGDWQLVYNPVDEQVGYIAAHWLTGDLTTVNCQTNADLGIFTLTKHAFPVTIYQCLSAMKCNKGLVDRGDEAMDICWDQSLGTWDLYFNLDNLQVGFSDREYFNDAGQQHTAC